MDRLIKGYMANDAESLAEAFAAQGGCNGDSCPIGASRKYQGSVPIGALELFMKHMDAFIEWKKENDVVPQEDFVVEECGELVQAVSKERRHNTIWAHDNVEEEACDVLCTVVAMLRMRGVGYAGMAKRMEEKMQRAIDRAAHEDIE